MKNTYANIEVVNSRLPSSSTLLFDGVDNVPLPSAVQQGPLPEVMTILLTDVFQAQEERFLLSTFTRVIHSPGYTLTLRRLLVRNCWELDLCPAHQAATHSGSAEFKDDTFGAHSARLFQDFFTARNLLAAKPNAIEPALRITTKACEKAWQASLFLEIQNDIATILGIHFPEQVNGIRLAYIIKHNWLKELQVLAALCTAAENRLRESGIPCACDLDVLINFGERHSYTIVKLRNNVDNPLAVVMRELEQEGFVNCPDYALVNLSNGPEDQEVRFITLPKI